MSKISVVDYLVCQLEKLGINEVFGLPGDFNFNIVEAIEKNENTNWIGCTNELNAGYAADGYARVKGYGAIVTTYGVGELSAINAIAGSYAEYVPVIKIVGVPSTSNIHNSCTCFPLIFTIYYLLLNSFHRMQTLLKTVQKFPIY